MFREEWQNMKNLLPAVFIALAVISCSCDTTEPPITVDPPGRRDYTWTRDTLRADDYGFISISGIWGSSENNVWAIGDAATYVNKIWHFNGRTWTNYLLDQYAEPIKLHGVANNELWMVTTNSDIWKWDGTKWYLHTKIIPPGYKRVMYEDIFGYKNNIYAVGIAEKEGGDYKGVIVYFNGTKWEIVNIPGIKEYFNGVLFLDGGAILIQGLAYEDPSESGRLYKFANGEISLIRKSKDEFRLGILKNKMYINTEKKVFEYSNGILNEVLNLSSTDYAGGLFGRSKNDFFTANYGWNLGHFDGSNLINIYKAEGNIIDIQIFERAIFVVCYTLDNINYILHGKLN
jgi:hypothetical protein